MKSASAELIALLNSGKPFYRADIFTITLNGGYIIRYTGADVDLIVDGNVFKKFNIKRGAIRQSVGVEVDTLTVKLYPDQGDTLNSAKWMAAAHDGAFDSADFTFEQVFMETWGDTSPGVVWRFSGRVADARPSRSECELTVKSELELLDTKLPRNLYQSGCLNSLYNTACGVVRENYAASGSVFGATKTSIRSGLSHAQEYFGLGTILFTSGANAGVTRSVRGFSGGTFTLAVPLLVAPEAGDTFTAFPGCDKTMATCQGKFSNLINFRGYPYVPEAETAT